jgi:rod shape-determining protein MreC
MLELRGVPTRIDLKPGTTIYTSGLGHTFPRGIMIGTVAQELKTAAGWTRTYLIRPSVSPSRVTNVFVLTAQRVTQGTGNIWGSTVNADSATKRIAAAGDSLVKQAALLQSQARQAALDSLKKATIDSVRRALGAAVFQPDVPVTTADSAGKRGAQPARPAAGTTALPRPDSARLKRDSVRRDTLRKPLT